MFITKIRAEGADDRSPYGNFWFEPIAVRSAAGVRVTADAAMRLSAVYASVRALAETMASLPVVLYRNRKDGGRDLVTDHWLYQLLARQPNRWQNAFEWRELMQGHLALRGNGYNRIVANGKGEIRELQPLHPDRMRIEVFDEHGRYRYLYRHADGSDEPLLPGEVFHLRGLSSDGLLGLNPNELARESIGIGIAAQQYGARFFANDARPMGGWIEYAGNFRDQAARETWRDSWQAGQSGNNRGKTAVLENGMKFHEVGLNNRDSQFIEARQFQVSDIARIFRIPPHLIGDLSKSTNNNIEQQSLEFVMYTMTPWAERWEAAIESQLMLEDDALEIEFDFANLLRGDQAARAEFYQSGIVTGWLTRNEARISENLDPIEGLDEPLQPLNMAGVDDADPDPGAGKPGKPVKPTPPGDQGAEPADRGDDEAYAARLARAVAARVVRKEIAAVGKYLRSEDAVRAFYDKHAAYVRGSFDCSEALAAAWCAERLAEVEASEDLGLTLASWESGAADELAARVCADVKTRKPQ